MQTSDLPLREINAALRELQGAARILHDKPSVEALSAIMRRLMLAQILGPYSVVAVGGSQSAGKSTLLAAMYDLPREWVVVNEGRGERLPVLVEERPGLAQPEGWAHVVDQTEDADGVTLAEPMLRKLADPAAFRRACSGGDAAVLMPVLRVPSRYFDGDRQGFVLLPGYEPRHRDNAAWQDVMRQVFLGASACVVVVDRRDLDTGEQKPVAEDLFGREQPHRQPLIVVSHTEGIAHDAQSLARVRLQAASLFGLQPEVADRCVVCTGTDDLTGATCYSAQWRPALDHALREIAVAGATARSAQAKMCDQLLGEELSEALAKIESSAMPRLMAEDDGEAGESASARAILAVFDREVRRLRSQHQSALGTMLSDTFIKAWVNLQNRLDKKHEGFINKIGRTFSTATTLRRLLEDDVLGAWREATQPSTDGTTKPVVEQYAALLYKLTKPTLKLLPAIEESRQAEGVGLMRRLGYVDDQGKEADSPMTDPAVQSRLRSVFRSRAGKLELSTNQSKEEVERVISLLPTMALEITRATALAPQLESICSDAPNASEQDRVLKGLQSLEKQFGDFRDVGGRFLRGFASVLAIDMAAEMEGSAWSQWFASETVTAPVDATTTATPTPSPTVSTGAVSAAATASVVAATVVAVVTVAYVAHTALREMRNHDVQVGAAAHAMLANIRTHQERHFEERFDALMGTLRRDLVTALRARFGLDTRLTDNDRLEKAIADVYALQRDALRKLSTSGLLHAADLGLS